MPVLMLLSVVISWLSGRSPVVAHRRVGQNGNPFWLFKFRTMWSAGARERREPGIVEYLVHVPAVAIKPRRDPRVSSRFAALCRTYSLDELPQLWNVLCGQMSLVGPRPLIDTELTEHYGQSAAEVLSQIPGITGLWQVMGRNTLSYRQRRRLDVFLVRRFSLRVYLWILLRTIPRVVSGSGAW
jgi:exopolysaccharide production protein ExoY